MLIVVMKGIKEDMFLLLSTILMLRKNHRDQCLYIFRFLAPRNNNAANNINKNPIFFFKTEQALSYTIALNCSLLSNRNVISPLYVFLKLRI